MRHKFLIIAGMCLLMGGYISCSKVLPGSPDHDAILDGPVEGLSSAESRMFLKGDIAFNDDIFTRETGLGPLFVATSCGTCHAGDGKGHPFTTLTRFGQRDTFGNNFLHMGGPQLQHQSVFGFTAESLPSGATFSKFTPPANTGLGFIEAVPDALILSLADENDANGDGISGRPNWVNIPSYSAIRTGTVIRNGKYIGRFGKKASVFDLLQQTVNAYNQDMGINSTYEHYNTLNGQEADPEVSNQTVQDVVFYLQTLKAPLQRKKNEADVVAGRQLFSVAGCDKCHTPSLTTGTSPISALNNKTFFPYTDLLLHDMGPALDDGYTEGTAFTSEWRTPPLWGLGLSQNSQGGQVFLMHDGRARSYEQAIGMHGGEATSSRAKFQQLNPAEKTQFIKFLESL